MTWIGRRPDLNHALSWRESGPPEIRLVFLRQMFTTEVNFQQLRRWATYAALNLFVVSVLGVILRYKAVFSLRMLDYKYLLQAHSHFAFSGWITTGLFVGLLHILHASGVALSPVYRYQFWLNQLSSFGMLISFTCEGYGTISILFSSVSILFSYWFAIRYLLDSRTAPWPRLVTYCVRLALLFLVLSSAGPFLLAYNIAHATANMSFYYNAVYLYLHFQYNGWFTFGVLTLLLWHLSRRLPVSYHRLKAYFVLALGIACIPAYCLSLLWTAPPAWVWITGASAAGLQIASLVIFLIFLARNWRPCIDGISSTARKIWGLSLAAFIIKLSLQALSATPRLGGLAFSHRSVIIAYLHLVVLGFVSFMLLGFYLSHGLVSGQRTVSKTGQALFVAGVVANEIVLVTQSLLQFHSVVWLAAGYYLLGAAVVMSAGAMLFSVSGLANNQSSL
jgi:hypothetical protein